MPLPIPVGQKFDARYRPSKAVIACAENLASHGYDVGNCSEQFLYSQVNYIKRLSGTERLLIDYDCWVTLPGELLRKTPEKVRCWSNTVLIEKETLLLDEIDEQFGLSDWIEIDITGCLDIDASDPEVPQIVRKLYKQWSIERYEELDDARQTNGPVWFRKLSPYMKGIYKEAKAQNVKWKNRQLADRKKLLTITASRRSEDRMFNAGWFVSLGKVKNGTYKISFDLRNNPPADVKLLKSISGLKSARSLIDALNKTWKDVTGGPIERGELGEITRIVSGTHPQLAAAMRRLQADYSAINS